MKRIYYNSKLKRLKILLNRVAYLLSQNSSHLLDEMLKLRKKIHQLLIELKYFYSATYLKGMISGSALLVFLCISDRSQAQSFNPPVENPFGLINTSNYAIPTFVDFDNDGDLDLLVGEADQDYFDYYIGNFQYFENVGTNLEPEYTTPVENPFWLYPSYFLAAPRTADIDNDGDIDVIAGELGGDIIYYENIGTSSEPDFWAPEANPFGITSSQFIALPTLADLDNDGDLDLLVADYNYDYYNYDPQGRFNYFENIGTANSPDFASPLTNPFGLSSIGTTAAPEFVDLDGDGDYDLIAGEYFLNSSNNSEDGRFQYFENIGSETEPEFAEPVLNPFGLESLYYYAFPAFADLDNDGDLDLLAGENLGSMQYFENTVIVGLNELTTKTAISIYPNPVSDLLTIKSAREIESVELIDLLGKRHFATISGSNQISLGGLSSGMYTLKILLKNGELATKSIIKN